MNVDAVIADTVAAAAARLDAAAVELRPCAPVRDLIGDSDLDAAYRVQVLVNRARMSRGSVVVGHKIGLTSTAVQQQLGVDRPDFGVLFDDMNHPSGSRVARSGFLQPRIEAEVAFVIGRDIDKTIDEFEAVSFIEYGSAALEIVDSRISAWNISITDTIADNASSGAFVLGNQKVDIADLDLPAVRMTLLQDGSQVSAGTGKDCLGNPLAALAWLSNTTLLLGNPIRAGEVVLSGALGPMVTVDSGSHYSADITGIGSVDIQFSDDEGGLP